MVGLVAAYVTKQLGVYYLVGAFVAGLVARLLQVRAPRLASSENLHAVKLFASFFVPFYFFYRGMNVPAGALQWKSLLLGLALTFVVTPLRVGVVWAQRRFVVHEDSRSSLRVGLALATRSSSRSCSRPSCATASSCLMPGTVPCWCMRR